MASRTAHRLAAALATSLALLPGIASAQIFRAYLSIDGNDANPCTLPAPCRLLPAALAAVASGGEIWMLDSANYNGGTVNVAKSVTILAVPGALGSVVALGGSAIEISTPSIAVTLRNLNIVPFPGWAGQTGVYLNAISTLLVQNCNVNGFTSGYGVLAAGSTRNAAIVDTVFANNNYAAAFLNGASGTVTGSHFSDSTVAVFAQSSIATTTRVRVVRSTATRGQYGFIAEALGNASAAVDLSVFGSAVDSMSQTGAYAYAEVGADPRLSVSDSLFSGNNVAVSSLNVGARTVARNNTIVHNSFGLVQNGTSYFESSGNNTVRDNTNNLTGAITVVAGN